MNEILQKRIEEAAHQYIQSDAATPENMKLAFGDFINGAKFALQNQWISVDEALPEKRRIVLILLDDGDVRVGYHSDMWYWCDGFVSSKNPNGDCNYSSSVSIKGVTHWMLIPELKGGKE